VVEPELQALLTRFRGKDPVDTAKSQHSVYQKGFRMIYANAVPIAAACQLGKDVVEDTLRTIFLAIRDMIKFDHNLTLQFGFATVSFVNRSLQVRFADYLTQEVRNSAFETNMRRSNSPVAQTWRTNTQEQFFKSSLGTLIRKPNAEVNQALEQRTEALRLMSLDMSSCARN
jgi:hypothetical protein